MGELYLDQQLFSDNSKLSVRRTKKEELSWMTMYYLIMYHSDIGGTNCL